MLLHCGIYSCFVLRKKTSRVFSCLILFRNCLFRLDPFQELFCQNGSFSGTVFSDWILFRNCLFRMDPFQELSFQTGSFSGTVLSKSAISHATMCPYQNTERKIPCKNCLQRHILFRKYLCRTYPLQELSLETISFAETVFANLILYRNCLCRPYPLQELPLQIKFFTHKNFLFTLQSFKKLILGNHNLSGKASLQLSFSGKRSSRYLNILHKFHFVIFSNFL